MAINVKSAGLSTPITRTATVGDASCTQIRADVGATITILADGAIFIFNNVAEGGPVPAAGPPSNRIALSETEAEQGLRLKVGRTFVGGKIAKRNVGGIICIAAQSGTVTVRVIAER